VRERTLIVPPPAPEITPDVAHQWLREKLGAYMELASAGPLADDKETREALHFLVLDVRTLAEACVRAIVRGEAVGIAPPAREDDAEDFDDRTEILATVVDARDLIRDHWREGHDLDVVFDELERALRERRRRA
jgi:hypothetical protein